MNKQYISIDLKSFFASVECVERGLNPLNTNLVVADSLRSDKTICLAVSPSLKELGLPGRARLFEVKKTINNINQKRKSGLAGDDFSSSSYNKDELQKNKNLKIDFIIATPRMEQYIKYSSKIYEIYLKYISPDDIYVYSIDEVFIDITNYLKNNNISAENFAENIINDINNTTGITATAGIGTNLFLSKVAMDIIAKKTKPNKNGIRIASLTEQQFRDELWSHTPITDFWQIGNGYKNRLEKLGLYTMGDIALCSVKNENDFPNQKTLFKEFGIYAELLIDHAWGWEPCTIKQIKEYKSKSKSISNGQVLPKPYPVKKAAIIINEMVDSLCLELVKNDFVTDKIIINIFYDSENYNKSIVDYTTDYYGKKSPKYLHKTINLKTPTSSYPVIKKAVLATFNKFVNPEYTIRKINVCAADIKSEKTLNNPKQLNFYDNNPKNNNRDYELQKTLLKIKNQFGKNSLIKAMDLKEDATAIERNKQIGGHKS